MPKTPSKMHIHDMVTIDTKSFRDRYLFQIPEIG